MSDISWNMGSGCESRKQRNNHSTLSAVADGCARSYQRIWQEAACGSRTDPGTLHSHASRFHGYSFIPRNIENCSVGAAGYPLFWHSPLECLEIYKTFGGAYRTPCTCTRNWRDRPGSPI